MIIKCIFAVMETKERIECLQVACWTGPMRQEDMEKRPELKGLSNPGNFLELLAGKRLLAYRNGYWRTPAGQAEKLRRGAYPWLDGTEGQKGTPSMPLELIRKNRERI